MKLTRVVLLTLCVMVAAPGVSSAQKAGPWIRVSPPDEPFRFLAPQRPILGSGKNSYGGLVAQGKSYTVLDKGVAYTVWSLRNVKYNVADAWDPDNQRPYLDSCVELVWESLLKPLREELSNEQQASAEMTYQREIYEPYSGREYQLRIGEKRGTVRIYAHENKIFVLSVLDKSPQAENTQRFFRSFAEKVKTPSPRLPVVATITADPKLLPPDHRKRTYGGPDDNSPDYNRVFSARETTVKAQVFEHPEPSYTAAARKYSVHGTVVLTAILGKDRQVRGIQVLTGLPHGLTEAAIAAARRLVFTPAQKDGHIVAQSLRLEYNFNLH